MARSISLTLSDEARMETIFYALDSAARRKILRLCAMQGQSVKSLSQAINASMSTTSYHVKTLKQAGLVNIKTKPASKGHEYIVSLEAVNLLIAMALPQKLQEKNLSLQAYRTELPVGAYADFKVVRPCGMANADGQLLADESIAGAFYSHRHSEAQIIWMTEGWLEYRIPCYRFAGREIESITISCELCSETANYDNTFKSEITFWLNDTELATYLSPGDFGGRPGKLTPPNWTLSATQYGLLVQIAVNELGTFLNGRRVSDVCANQFDCPPEDGCLRLRIGNKPDAHYRGGFNIFGKAFGDFPQDIKFDLYYYTTGRTAEGHTAK